MPAVAGRPVHKAVMRSARPCCKELAVVGCGSALHEGRSMMAESRGMKTCDRSHY